MRMNCLIERQMYRDINDFIEQISWFAARDIINHSDSAGSVEFDNEILELIECFCNCRHVHDGILNEIKEDIERELFSLHSLCYQIKVTSGKIFFTKY